jgi:hypothetical protein
MLHIRQFHRPRLRKIGKWGLDNCAEKRKKALLAQQFPVFAAAGVAQQQLRENCCGKRKKVMNNE